MIRYQQPQFSDTAENEDCHQTSGGSWLCVPKPTNPTVARAPHTGNLYEMREKAESERKITAAELGPGWRELLPGEECIGKQTHLFIREASGQRFCNVFVPQEGVPSASAHDSLSRYPSWK